MNLIQGNIFHLRDYYYYYYWPDGPGFKSRQRQEIFHFSKTVQTRSGAHPAFYSVATGALSPGVKRPGRKVDYSPPSSAEVKNEWSYTSAPSICL